jgi:transcriptional coactivator HFI1/ADA1
MSSRSLNGSLSQSTRPGRTGASRIDLEPVYTALKAAIGDNWPLYRDSLGGYTMGEYIHNKAADKPGNYSLLPTLWPFGNNH